MDDPITPKDDAEGAASMLSDFDRLMGAHMANLPPAVQTLAGVGFLGGMSCAFAAIEGLFPDPMHRRICAHLRRAAMLAMLEVQQRLTDGETTASPEAAAQADDIIATLQKVGRA